ncbi:amidohydrolase family protein [Novosphingobium sp.]|uniref:amidohydrolase family protein n=1 Tax=Novosphingobium sp. TaxID=1874826 RepID=UPI002619C014|nr:amidohydrolase family protein [Novosphingobium sp.]
MTAEIAPSAPSRLVIRQAELADGSVQDVLVEQGVIRAIGPALAVAGAVEIAAAGGFLLPGLADHHLHLAATTVGRQSVPCGPPQVDGPEALARALTAAPGSGWIRGIGYHESVAGLPTCALLDEIEADRPLRIQHRSGRMWFFNSAGLDRLLSCGEPLPDGLERSGGVWTGRLFDADAWLRRALAGTMPDFTETSATLARWGVTALTDMSVANGLAEARHFRAQQDGGALWQKIVLAGSLELAGMTPQPALARGAFKLHLHEAHLPDWSETLARMGTARQQDRGTAIHCVTEAELAFAIGLLAELGTVPGDRIEHGSVVSDGLRDALAGLGVPVVVQPAFVPARGDRYLADIPPAEWPWLYRLAGLQQAGLVLAGGSDAPYGPLDPWEAMRAAVERRTASGAPFGPAEALSPEAALALYLADPLDLRRTRRVAPDEPGDLCLLDRPWREARANLAAGLVRLTLIDGRIVFDRDAA